MSETIDASARPEEAARQAGLHLRAGEAVVLPTDTVYGVAADAFNADGTTRVFAVKQRQRDLPLPVLVRSPKQLLGLCTQVPEVAERLMAAYWPGPLTLVVPVDPNLRWELGENQGTVAVRMPLDEVCLAIIREVGPLAVTSANRSGQPAATTVDEARAQLGDEVGCYVDDGPRREVAPSTIVDLTRREPEILREGALDSAEVLAVARGDLDPLQAGGPDPEAGGAGAGE